MRRKRWDSEWIKIVIRQETNKPLHAIPPISLSPPGTSERPQQQTRKKGKLFSNMFSVPVRYVWSIATDGWRCASTPLSCFFSLLRLFTHQREREKEGCTVHTTTTTFDKTQSPPSASKRSGPAAKMSSTTLSFFSSFSSTDILFSFLSVSFLPNKIVASMEYPNFGVCVFLFLLFSFVCLWLFVTGEEKRKRHAPVALWLSTAVARWCGSSCRIVGWTFSSSNYENVQRQ